VLEEGEIGGTPAAFWTVTLPGGKQGNVSRSYAFWELGERLIMLNAAGLTREEVIQVAESLQP
jgi:hypothetical protein